MPEDPSERTSRPEGGEIATSTLAEIYAQQGLLGRALGIYRRMLARTPEDGEIAGRIERLERQIEESVEAEGEDGPATTADPVASDPSTEEVAAGEAPAPDPEPEERERLPWDPPEDEAEPASPQADGPSGHIAPLDPEAFEAWLADR
jgi:hypothetical protein